MEYIEKVTQSRYLAESLLILANTQKKISTILHMYICTYTFQYINLIKIEPIGEYCFFPKLSQCKTAFYVDKF